jgi:hypothetical protein
MKEVLIRLKEKLERNIAEGNEDTTYGLCGIADHQLGHFDYTSFKEYTKKYIKSRKVFYTYEGVKTSDKSQFLWMPKNYASRLKWLDKNIKSLSKE